MSEENAVLEVPEVQATESMSDYLKRTSDTLTKAVAIDTAKQRGPRKAEQTKDTSESKTTEANQTKPVKDDAAVGDENRDAADHDIIPEDAAEKLSAEGASFARLRKSNKAAIKALNESKGRLSALEKEIADLKAKPATAVNNAELDSLKSERESLKKERDELSTLLKRVGLERSPEFQKKYTGRMESVMETAKRMLPSDLFDRAKAVLAMQPSAAKIDALEQLAEGLSPMRSNLLAQFSAQMDQVIIERDAELAEGAKSYEALVQNEAQKRQAKQGEYQAVFDQALNKIMSPESGIDLFRKNGKPEQDAAVDEMTAVAKRAWSGEMPAEQLATLQLWGAAYPNQLKTNLALSEALAEANKTIAELRGATPSVKAGEEGGGDDASLKAKDGETMADYGRRIAPRFGIAR